MKYLIKLISLWLTGLLVSCLSPAWGQVSQGGTPISRLHQTAFAEAKILADSYYLPALNNETISEELDAILENYCKDCPHSIYGKAIPLELDIREEGYLTTLDDGGKIWLLPLESPSAYGFQFYFSAYNLPPGAKLFIYDADMTMILGAFTSANNQIVEQDLEFPFGTQSIKGNRVYLEYYEPAQVEFEGQLTIGEITHIFEAEYFGESSSTTNNRTDPCYYEENVRCPTGTGWEKEINSVAKVEMRIPSLGYSSRCSGALINNTQEDGRPFFLMADHCMFYDDGLAILTMNPLDWVFYFHYQTDFCGDGHNVPIFPKTIYGAQKLSAASDIVSNLGDYNLTDYLLLELSTSPAILESYGVCYAGWSRQTSQISPVTAIHHPKGLLKKITQSGAPLSSIDLDPTIFGNEFWSVDGWNTGCLWFGSSGSPLFNGNHQIIGQALAVTGQNPSISQQTYYGKFNESWDLGGFSFWLDPHLSGVLTLDTYCPNPQFVGGTTPGGTTTGLPGPCRPREAELAVYGFKINGRPEGITEVCLTDPNGLTIQPHDPCALIPTIHLEEIGGIFTSGNCNTIQAKDPYYCFNTGWPFATGCRCLFEELIIAITEVDDDLNPISTEQRQQVRLASDDVWHKSTLPGGVVYGGTDGFNLLDYLPNGMTLQAGKTYKLELEGLFDGSPDSHVRFFHTYSDGVVEFEGSSLNRYLYGGEIILRNTEVTTFQRVEAERSISIQPNTLLADGEYEIGDVSCAEFHMPQRIAQTDSKGNEPSTFTNLGKETKVERTCLIYPNPSFGIFEVAINSLGIDQNIYRIEVVDFMGKRIMDFEPTPQQEVRIQLEDVPPGFYFIKAYDVFSQPYHGKVQITPY